MESTQNKALAESIIILSRNIVYLTVIVILCMVIIICSLLFSGSGNTKIEKEVSNQIVISAPLPAFRQGPGENILAPVWKAPEAASLSFQKNKVQILYGKSLITNTAQYLGPEGTVAHLSNGMNCQNCHLAGGSKIYGNNFGSFMANYPKFSARNGKISSPADRIKDCFERSLNGRSPDTSSKEMKAILAYMRWIGTGVKKGTKLFGTATEKLAFMNKAAGPVTGKAIFIAKCQVCHGKKGEGLLAASGKSYTYPPLWGKHSYNDGAGMYRAINLAGFVKNNMPFGATYQNPQLTDEEAWDVAAFVNSQPRPHKDQKNDYPDLKQKPIDFPFGPYADRYNAHQHKFGPYGSIQGAQLKHKKSL